MDCRKCCSYLIDPTRWPFLEDDEYERFKQYAITVNIHGNDHRVVSCLGGRCSMLRYNGEGCVGEKNKPKDCRLFPFLVKDGQMVISLYCPDAVRLLQSLNRGEEEAVRFYNEAKEIINNASEGFIRHHEWYTKDFRFWCVVK